MYRVRQLAFAVALVHLIAILGVPFGASNSMVSGLYGVAPAHAQDAKPKKRRSLFSILFGKKKTKKKAVAKKKRTKRSKKSRTASAASKAAAVKALPKSENAKVILVVGDFFASGLADGLTTALAQAPTLKVVNKAKGLSGFVRTDIVDWSQDLQPLVEEHRPSYIVAMLGSNDRQQMRNDGKRLKKMTPEWLAAYSERVNSLGKALKDTGIRYAWVGLPPVRFKSMTKDFLQFNEIYGKAATSRNGRFLDVWDGFSDAEGNYSRSGPDVNGQIVLLRAKDGINLTRAGKRRLSYYVEGAIQRLFGADFSGPGALAGTGFDAETFSNQSPDYDPAKSGKTFVIRLDDPAADGGDVLAGDKIELPTGPAQIIAVPAVSEQPVAATAAVAGRVDNFVWPPQGVSSQVVRPVAVEKPKKPQESVLPQQSKSLQSVLDQAAALQN
ncbi:MAG: SGNH family hydrolase [Rhizobiaceae bacterium]